MNLCKLKSWVSLVSCSLVLTLSVSAHAEDSKLKKNVMILMVDDLRPQLNGFGQVPDLHGQTQMHTPALDALGEQGTIFERAYCAVPICGASRLSLLTGSRPYKEPGKNWGRHWTYYSRLDAADQTTPAGVNHPGVTLPQHFKNNGYKLYSIGKVYHNKDDDKAVWDDLVKLQHPWKDVPAFEIGVGDNNEDDAYPDGQNTSDVISKLDGLKDDPFLYCVGFPRPHLPFWAPKKYWDLYPEDDIQLPSNYSLPVHAPQQSIHNWGELRNYSEVEYADEKKTKVSDAYARTLIRGYYASVSYVDAQIERIVDKLKSTYDSQGVSLYDKTTIVVWGDHGWNLGEHTLWAKHALYNTSTQIPIIIRDPELPGGKRVSSLVESVDLYPTLCDLVGIGRPEPTVDNDGSNYNLHGSSLLPLINDPEAPWKPAAFTRYDKGDSVRTERYSYTEFTNVSDQVVGRMLYDLKYDPDENYNIVDVNPELRSSMSKLLGRTPEEKRNAWRALVDEFNDNTPLAEDLKLPEAKHPSDYLNVLSGQYNANMEYDSFGGWKGKTFSETGFFRTEHDGDRWWFVTPVGNAFISFGVNHYHAGWWRQDYNLEYWLNAFGGKAAGDTEWQDGFRKVADEDLNRLGINTLGMHTDSILWTDEAFVASTPYLRVFQPIVLDHYRHPGAEAYMDVFSPEYAERCRELAQREVAPYKDDPMLIGYCMSDCPIFTENDIRFMGGSTSWPRLLRNLGGEAPGKQAYVNGMKSRYKSIEEFNEAYGTSFLGWEALLAAENWRADVELSNSREAADNDAFLLVCVDRYYSVAKEALDEADPNHLFFGDKLNGNTDNFEKVLDVVGRYVDVFLYQFYGSREEQVALLDKLAPLTDIPFLNGDVGFATPDETMPNPHGPHAESQAERAQWLEDACEVVMRRPESLGWHMCGIIDTNVSMPGKEQAQHQGLMTVTGEYYSEMETAVRSISDRMYSIAAGDKEK